MPEFENLEPYLDKEQQGRITPVAPHYASAQEYRPRRQDHPVSQTSRRLRPKPVQLDESERYSTDQMEKEFKERLQEEKAGQRRRAPNPLRRLWNKIRSLFKASSAAKSKRDPAAPRRNKRPRDDKDSTARDRGAPSPRATEGRAPRGDGAPPRRKRRKGKATGEPGSPGGSDGAAHPSGTRSGGARRGRPGRDEERSARPGRDEERSARPGRDEERSSRPGRDEERSARPERSVGPPPEAGQAREAPPPSSDGGDKPKRNRRNRSRRNRGANPPSSQPPRDS
jgi:hypothetical protein